MSNLSQKKGYKSHLVKKAAVALTVFTMASAGVVGIDSAHSEDAYAATALKKTSVKKFGNLKKGYTVYTGITLTKKAGTTDAHTAKTLYVQYSFQKNGKTYYRVLQNKKHFGVVEAAAFKQAGNGLNYFGAKNVISNRQVQITAKDSIYSNLNSLKVAGSTEDHIGEMTVSNGYFNHYNGQRYYALYQDGKLFGYVNTKALKANATDLTALNAAIKAADELKAEDYTKASFEAFAKVLDEAKATAKKVGVNKADADAAVKALDDATKALVKELRVESVSAINSTTLSVTGTGLSQLKPEAITVDNNSAKAVVASEDGKTATVTLNNKLVVDVKTTVKMDSQSFEVTYSIKTGSLAVVSATYDDDTKDQYVAITIDGQKVTAQELIDAGYNVEFTGFAKKSGTKLNNLFTSGSAASTTGELDTKLGDTSGAFVSELASAGVISTGATELPTAGIEIFVQAKISKGTETIQSEVSPIKIQNLDLATQSIKEYALENLGANKADEVSAVDAIDGTSVTDSGSDDFIQKSTTLVTGEKAAVRNITIVNDNKEELVLYSSKLVTVSTSNEAVVSVDTATGVLTAQTPGTATITFAYGTQTKTAAITVTNTKRELNKAVVTEDDKVITSKTMIKNVNGTFTGTVYDQYGDPISTPVTAKVTNTSTTTPVAWLNGSADSQTVTAPANGKIVIDVEPKNPGNVAVTFHDAAGNKLTNSQLRINVTANADLASYKLATLDKDADLILDSLNANDNKGEVVVKGLTSENVDLGVQALTASGTPATDVNIIKSTVTNTVTTGYTLKWAESVVGLVTPSSVKVTPATNSLEFVVAQGKSGTVTLTFINNTTNKQASITYTVKAEGENIKSAALKTIAVPTFGKTIDYKDVLTNTQSENDPIIKGLTLTSSTAQPVRLNLGGVNVGTGAMGDLYIDKNADGKFNAGDVKVGSLALTLVGNFANATSTVPAGWASAIPTTPTVGDVFTAANSDVYTYVADSAGDSSNVPGWNKGSTTTAVSLPTFGAGDVYTPNGGSAITYNAAVTTPADAISGVAVRTGDKGTIIYKVLDKDGNVQASSSVKVNF